MTGKDMLKGIQNMDADLIEEAEFGTFGKKQTRFSGKTKLLLVLAASPARRCSPAGQEAPRRPTTRPSRSRSRQRKAACP